MEVDATRVEPDQAGAARTAPLWPHAPAGAHILTVNAEEYFHGGALARTVRPKHWDRLESRFRANVERTLDLLESLGARATFFVFGWNAERHPKVVREIADRGHEVASRGYWPHGISEMVPDEFREELARTRDALLAAGVPAVLGFRSARWLRPTELWALDVLMEEGYAYDASVNPILRRFAGDERFHRIHRHRHSAGGLTIVEVPVSTVRVPGLDLPISGGNYWRQTPLFLLRRLLRRRLDGKHGPLVLYFTPWELDPEQPMLGGVSPLNRIRQYRNLGRAMQVLESEFRDRKLVSIAEYLGLDPRAVPARSPTAEPALASEDPPSRAPAPVHAEESAHGRAGTKQAVAVVVPLHNEAPTLPYLQRTLADLAKRLADRYELEFILVDDGSTDDTLAGLERLFSGRPGFRILALGRNRGVAGAILEGIRSAATPIVCSMDCDCSYDPAELERMIPLLEATGADLVTASPYHPDGEVYAVPRWRLFLSRNLSRLYNIVVGQKIHTYTSCFRVYRRSAVEDIELEHGGFLGVAEFLLRVLERGGKVVEHPATLEARLFGKSKMKTLRTIAGHLGLLWSVFRNGKSGTSR